ncbi:hypothetical protein Bbelb_365960 [Branchiostoma belcheri]|nr:hypothetical protein Bbelb_365960 [Branchiostoma belcheri]
MAPPVHTRPGGDATSAGHTQACNTYQPSCGKTCSRRTCLENMLNWQDIHTGSSQHLALSHRQRAGFADRPNSVITCISVEECWVSCVCSRKVISHGVLLSPSHTQKDLACPFELLLQINRNIAQPTPQISML